MRATLLAFALLFAQEPTPASVEGIALNSVTNEPIGRASVALIKFGGRPSDARIVATAADGKFVIRNVPPGRYSLAATRSNFIRFVYGQFGANGPGHIELTDGQAFKDVIVKMTPTAVIAGRIFNQDGELVADVNVRAQKATYRDGERTVTIVKEVPTNDLGEYRLSGLPPGSYFVSAVPPQPPRIEADSFVQPTPPRPDGTPAGTTMIALQTAIEAGLVNPNVIAGDVYPEVFFPGTTDPATATFVDLKGGATFSGVDITTIRTRQARVRGQVINGVTGEPVRNVTVSANLRGVQTRFSFRNAFGSNTGTFEFAGLVPGAYVLSAGSEGLSARVPVQIGSADLENVVLALRPPLTLTGRVTIEGRAFSELDLKARLRFTLHSKVIANDSMADVQPNGSFTFTGVSGLTPGEDYQIGFIELVSSRRVLYLKAARLGAIDVLASGIRLDRETNAPLEVLLSPNSAVLDSIVLAERQAPVPDATVVLVPAPARRRISDFYKTATSDASGRVHFEAIVPGDYKIFAWQEIEAGTWQDSEVIRKYESRGEPIHFDEGSKLNTAVTLIPQ